MTIPADAIIGSAIAKIDARRAVTGPIDTEYAAKVQTPDGRLWSLRIKPITQGEHP